MLRIHLFCLTEKFFFDSIVSYSLSKALSRGNMFRLCSLLFKKSAPASIPPWHIAIPVHSVPKARAFYGKLLGGKEGRRDGDNWQDYNWEGHQLVCHFAGANYKAKDYFNPVDVHNVPVPHYGLCLTVPKFKSLANKLIKNRTKFIIDPALRWPGTAAAQHTMFFKDPSGNNIECKAMVNPKNLFAKGGQNKTVKKRISKK